MARTIYINTDNGSIESAPVAGLNRPSARVPLREIVAGTTETYNLYLVKSDGTYDSRSGSGAVSVNVAIGQRAQTATSGNFTVTDSSGTSAEISATASAQAVEDVLNAMNSGTGAESGLCDVKKLGSGIWLATWRENGVRAVLTGASVDLTPESVVVPSISVTGDASSKCQQIIEVNRQPAIFQDTWSTITNGFSGTLDADVGRIVQAMSDGQSIDFYFEVRIDDDAICSTPIRMLAPVGGAASVSSAAPYGGTLASDPANYPGFSVSAWESALSIEGFSAIAPDDEAVIRGNGTEWVKASNFRVDAGTANSGTEMGTGTADGVYAVAEGFSTTASGNYSHAEGYLTTAFGVYSHSEGRLTEASDVASHAEGYSTTSSGFGSHAEGQSTAASGVTSHAEGYLTTAEGNYSHAEGQSTTASGVTSHAEGLSTTAEGIYSHAEGQSTLASGIRSHAEGYFTIAEGDTSHAEGDTTIATGLYSHAEGRLTEASGVASHAEGQSTTAFGDRSHAEGLSTLASGIVSHAEGAATTASGEYSHAEGILTTAEGDRSHAEGDTTMASGSRSHAEGFSTIASGDYSHAEGFLTTASGAASHAEGSFTTASGDYSSATGRRGKAIHNGARVEADSQDADVSSTTTNQFTARFQNGYEFKGGLAAFESGASFGDAATQATTRSNLGVAIYGQLYFSATTETTIAVAGTYVKLAGTTTSDSLNGITMPQNNRLQNNSGTTRVFQAMARTDIIDGSGNKAVGIKLAKNGVLIDPTESNGETTNNVGAHAIINWIVSLADGEYVEIWATNDTDTSSIYALHGHLFLKAID
jgi:hypothetical protein